MVKVGHYRKCSAINGASKRGRFGHDLARQDAAANKAFQLHVTPAFAQL